MTLTRLDEAPTALQVPLLAETLGHRVRCALLGRPLTREHLAHERLSKRLALGVLASDCISSSAYGSEEMLIVLLPAFGLGGFAMLLPLTAVILVVLAIVTLSYRDVVSVYSQTGGSYVVARENFGPKVAQIGAVALMLDYIVTVAVQTAAGTAALTSAFHALSPYGLEISVGWILVMFYGNLRGIREAGKTFALPTYIFGFAMVLVIVTGLTRAFFGDLPMYVPDPTGTVPITATQQVLTWGGLFMLLRAFANGGASLTGLEAISNGVSVFKAPEGRNARKTLLVMSVILGSLVGGVSWLAFRIHATPYVGGTPTVISQVAHDVFGPGPLGHALFLLVQFATMGILWTGANTPFSGFPFLASFVAEDQFLPRQLTRRGHRLAFSNGIIVLTAASLALIIFTNAHVDQLVAFYAIGVFTGFTLAGLGMAKYFRAHRTGRWQLKVAVNTVSGLVSLCVVVIFAVVKFTEGAWLIVVIFPVAVAALIRLNRQYRAEAQALRVEGPGAGRGTLIRVHRTLILVDGVDLATVATARYARSLRSSSITAVHFVLDEAHARSVQRAWNATPALREIPLELVDCPDRRLVRGALELAMRTTTDNKADVTVLLPRRSYSAVIGRLLHDHTADAIAGALSQLPRVVATVVPYDVAGAISHRMDDSGPRAEAALGSGSASVPQPRDPAPTDEHQAIITISSGEPARDLAPQRERGRPAPAAPRLLPAPEPGEPEVTAISELVWRRRATVEGAVRSVRCAPMSGAPSVEVDVWDVTGGVTLIFYGRTEIAGIEPGRWVRATGLVGARHGRFAVANPAYELVHPAG